MKNILRICTVIFTIVVCMSAFAVTINTQTNIFDDKKKIEILSTLPKGFVIKTEKERQDVWNTIVENAHNIIRERINT